MKKIIYFLFNSVKLSIFAPWSAIIVAFRILFRGMMMALHKTDDIGRKKKIEALCLSSVPST